MEQKDKSIEEKCEELAEKVIDVLDGYNAVNVYSKVPYNMRESKEFSICGIIRPDFEECNNPDVYSFDSVIKELEEATREYKEEGIVKNISLEMVDTLKKQTMNSDESWNWEYPTMQNRVVVSVNCVANKEGVSTRDIVGFMGACDLFD